MSTHGGSQDVPTGDQPDWDPGSRAAREMRAIQARELVGAFARVGVSIGIAPADDRPDEADFFYTKGVVLVRDEDVDRVRRLLGLDGEAPRKDDPEQDESTPKRPDTRYPRRPDPNDPRGQDPAGTIDGEPGRAPASVGLTRLTLPSGRETLEVLEDIDRAFGEGVASPDHVLHVCGNSSGCPATRPLPTKGPVDPPPTEDDDLGRGVRVVVTDTGFISSLGQSTPWLTGVTGDEEDENEVGSYRGHGTFIAGVVRSVAPAADIEVESILWVGGAIQEYDLLPALKRSLESMPDIISMSAGTTTYNGRPLMSMQVFWEKWLRHVKGTVLVCAAGNDGNRGPFWPAAFPWSVSVGALDAHGCRAPYSNFGSWVDVWARGSDVVNAYPDGDYTYAWPANPPRPQPGETATFDTGLASWSGTSFSTPLVSGLVAARMSWSGESARDAATALLRQSVRNATRGVGAILSPGMADAP